MARHIHLAYLVHNLNDPAVARRCEMLERGGAKIALAGFCRDERLTDLIAKRGPLILGQSADAAMAHRAASTLKNAVFNGTLRRWFEKCDTLLVRNLEQLAIARSIVGDRPLVYECLDIHRSLVGNGTMARVVQRLEAALLPRVDTLITSSPAFVSNHFAKRPLTAPIEIVENKLLVDGDSFVANRNISASHPITIGWFGMLRCRKTLDFLTKVVQLSDGKFEVLVAGKPSLAELPNLEAEIDLVPGMRYVGPYKYDDLPHLYGQCHFAWTIDWFEEGLNSSWLLPNRLYEPLAYGVTPIALRHVEVGQWLERNNVGLLVDDEDQVAKRLLSLTADDIVELEASALSIDRSKLVADQADCLALVEMLSKVTHS